MFLPHWVFDIEVSVKYRGKVGFAAGDGKTEWMSVDAWKDGGTTKYDATNPAVQICASFKHRRDLVAAVTGPHVGKLPSAAKKPDPTRESASSSKPSSSSSTSSSSTSSSSTSDGVFLAPMPDAAAAALAAARDGAGPPGSVLVERFGLKRSLAWELATRRVREAERAKASEKLRAAHAADVVRDVVLEVELHPGRRVRAVRLPAYLARYTHGETVGVDGKIVPTVHRAVICGATGAVRVSDEIFDHGKARALAVLACVAPAGAAAFAFGPESFNIIAAQAFLASAVASTLAGVVARRLARLERDAREAARVADEESAFAAATRHGPGDRAWMDEPTQQRRDDVEWGRWKETDKGDWDEDKREEWAASIWQWQKIRRRERVERRRTLEEARAREEEAERRDEEKERRWGPGWRKETGAGKGRGGGGGGRDPKGYYRLLGLSEKRGAASPEEIKSAYRRVAMEWHPDKHQGAAAKERAAKTFRELQRAYQVLGNQQEREVYDGM